MYREEIKYWSNKKLNHNRRPGRKKNYKLKNAMYTQALNERNKKIIITYGHNGIRGKRGDVLGK